MHSIKFDAYSLWLLLVGGIFLAVYFLSGPQALIAVSLTLGYPHLFFTGYYFKKEGVAFFYPVIVFATLASIVQLNVSLVMTIYLFLQPVHYNYQNWLLTSLDKNLKTGFFWILIMAVHYALIYAMLEGLPIPSLTVLCGLGLVGFFGSILMKIDQKAVAMGLLFLLVLSLMGSKESLLAMAAGWHGLQYILNILAIHKIEQKVRKHFMFGLILVAMLYSISASYFVAAAANWAIVVILSLNLTHYLFDFIFMGRDYLSNESQAKSIYF